MTGAEQLALLSFFTLFIWVPFALAAWILNRIDPLEGKVSAWHVLPQLERHRVRTGSGDWFDPIPLPSH